MTWLAWLAACAAAGMVIENVATLLYDRATPFSHYDARPSWDRVEQSTGWKPQP